MSESRRCPDAGLAEGKERAWRALRDIDAALDRGDIDEAGWHQAVLALVEPAYLAGGNPRAQSGHGGDPERWEQARRLLVDALPGNCDLLDIGCANGHLMECLVRWAAQDGHQVEPFGVEISAALADLARTRCPQWAERIWTGNAADWEPPRRFTVVRTGLDYVPPGRRAAYVTRLRERFVAPGGRLVIGVFNEERDDDALERAVSGWGHRISGRSHREHRHPALAYKVFWIDV